jgi:hypothetical protein
MGDDMSEEELKVQLTRLQEQVTSLCRSMDLLREELHNNVMSDREVREFIAKLRGVGMVSGIFQVIIMGFVAWVFNQVMNHHDAIIALQAHIGK